MDYNFPALNCEECVSESSECMKNEKKTWRCLCKKWTVFSVLYVAPDFKLNQLKYA